MRAGIEGSHEAVLIDDVFDRCRDLETGLTRVDHRDDAAAL